MDDAIQKLKDVFYDLILQKAFSLVSKRRYTVLKLKKKLIEFLQKETSRINEGKSRLEEPIQKVILLSQETKEFQEETLKKVLQRLKELKYLDDTQYGLDYIENQIAFRPRGAFRLKRELQTKGLHPDLAAKLLNESEIDEEEVASEALKKKLKSIARFPREKQKEKAMRFLASRGFPLDAIYKVVDRWYNNSAI